MASRSRSVTVVCVVCMLVAACQAASDLYGRQVPFKISLSSGSVSASAECGRDQSGKVAPMAFNCKGDVCSKCGVVEATNYSAAFAVDGNLETGWQSPPLSSGTYYNVTYLTVDLGWSYSLAWLNLAAGNSPLPRHIAVFSSRDGVAFSPSVYYVDALSRCPSFTTPVQGDVATSDTSVAVLCTDGLAQDRHEINISLSRELSSIEAQYIRLELADPRAAAGNDSDPTQLFFSISELSIFVTCPQVPKAGSCFGPNIVRHVVPSLQQDQTVRLLWQQEGLSFPGEWYLSGLSLVSGACSDQRDNNAATCIQYPLDTCSRISTIGGNCTMDVPCDVSRDNMSKVYFGQPGLRQALSSPVYIGVNQTATFDIAIVSYPPQCTPKVNPIEVRACPGLRGTQNCSLVSIVSAGECGYCVDKLLLQLVNLTEVMNSTLLLLPNVYLDGTTIISLYNRTMKVKNEVAIYAAHIYIDGVVIGSYDAIPADIEVPPVVFRLDLNLTHSLLYLISAVNETLISFDKLSLPAQKSNASMLVGSLDVGAVLKPANELLVQVNASLNAIISFVSAISANLTKTKMAVTEANNSLTIIQYRNFTSISLQATSTLHEANETLIINQGFYEETKRINNSLILLFEQVQNLTSFLRQLTVVEVLVNKTLQNVTEINYSVSNLLIQIKALSLEASSLNESIYLVLTTVSSQVAQGSNLLTTALKLSQNVTALLSSLSELLNRLENLVSMYENELKNVIVEPCDESGDQCTAGQLYARTLLAQYRSMYSSWIPTKTYGLNVLAMYKDISLWLDFDTLNHIAQNALNESMLTTAKLSTVNITVIGFNATSLYNWTQVLYNGSIAIHRNATATEAAVNTTASFYTYLLSNYTGQAVIYRQLQNDTTSLSNMPDYTQQANLLSSTNSVILSNLSNATGTLVYLENKVNSLESNLNTIINLQQNTTFNLNYTNLEFDVIGEFINESRDLYNSLNFNISNILQETQMILGEIDSIVNSLGSLYNSLNKINAPVVFSPTTVSSYVSLQPPPSTQLANGSIQFESLDLFLTSSPSYVTPALIFYAGPLTYGTNNVSLQEDFFFITAESSFFRLRWQLGYYSGDIQLPQTISGSAHISVTRVGSQFQLQYSTGTLDPGVTSPYLLNNSILFHTTNSTIFLIGGRPDGALLAPGFTIQGTASFYGQYQMIFFNGQPWGLWSVRGTSKTNLIGNKEFLRNPYIGPLLWHGIKPRPIQSLSALSFDGTGYLFAPMFYNNTVLSTARTFTVRFFLHPSVTKRSLVAFMYDQKGVTFELALLDNNYLMFTIKNLTSTFSQSIPFADTLSFQFTPSTSVLQVNSKAVNGTFFQKLSDVKTWFGGINYNFVNNSLVPTITNSSYSGCLDISVTIGTSTYPVFLTDSTVFVNSYLNSPYQRGVSAACFLNDYTRLIGLNGMTYLQYTSLQLVPKPEETLANFAGFAADTVAIVGISFTPVRSSGVLFVLADQSQSAKNKLFAAMVNGTILVGITNGSSNTPILGRKNISLGSTHHLLVKLDVPQNLLSFYLDGMLDGPASSFQIKPSASSSNVTLHLGGVSKGLVNVLNAIPYYAGCLSDLTYGFRAVDLGAPTSKPADATFSTCPYLGNVWAPSLEVEAPPPKARQCLSQPPLPLDNSQGSFLATTQLLANEVLGLFARSWSLGFSLKYISDGHILSVQSLFGHRVTVLVVGNQLVLEAYVGGVKMASRIYPTRIVPLKFFNVAILCSVDGLNLSCSLQLDGVSDLGGVVQVPYPRTVFVPLAPITLGAASNVSTTTATGFIGCLSGLNINGDGSVFSRVKTIIPCFNNTEAGYGFRGTSQVAWTLSSSFRSISVVFRPLLDNGLLLLLSSGSQPIFAVGLFNGMLMAANYSRVLGTTTALTSQPLCSVNSPITADYMLNVTYTFFNGQLGSITALITSEPNRTTTFWLTNVPDNLLLTLGGVPDAVVVPAQSKWFSYLLTNNVNQDSLPSNFEGCIKAVYLNGGPLSLTNAPVLKDILIGLCPAAG